MILDVYQAQKRIKGIHRFFIPLLLGLGVALVGGCTHKNQQSSKNSCSDVTKPYGHKLTNCSLPTKSQWQTKVATNHTRQQPPHTIGEAPVTVTEQPVVLQPLLATSDLPLGEFETKTRAPNTRASYADLTSILRHTLRDNPDIGIAWAQERDEHTAIDIARAALHPTVSVRAAYGPENYESSTGRTTGVPRQEFGIDLHQVIFDFGRTQGNIARRKALHNSAGYRRIGKMNKVALEVSQAFLSILEASKQINIAQQNVASHQEIYQLVSASQKAGAASIADVKRVTTRLDKAKTNLIDLRSRKQNAREEFIRLTDLRPANLSRPPHFRAPLPPKGLPSDQYPDNPELFSIRADIDSLRAQAKTARANFQPSIDLDVSGNVKDNISGETGQTSGFKSLISFNYKILDGDKRLNILKQVLIRIDENKHRYRKKRRSYIADLEQAIRTVRTNQEKSSLLSSRLHDSKKVLSLYKAQFKDGSKTVFELLDAQLDLFTTNGEKIANDYGKLRSIYEIFALRGDLVARLLK